MTNLKTFQQLYWFRLRGAAITGQNKIISDLTIWLKDSACVSLSLQATKDLENYDAERHEEFKRYEMLKEHERREYLKGLDQEKREKEEKRMQELKEKHRQHPKVNAPVLTNASLIFFLFFCGDGWKWVELSYIFVPLCAACSHIQGSVAQLREVWEETDGLDPQEFNPKTFFKLHGELHLVPF